MWGGYTDSDIANEVFRSDAMQMRIEKRAFGDANSTTGVMTFVFSWTFSKEYSTTCCWGNSWQDNTGAVAAVEPQRQHRNAGDLPAAELQPEHGLCHGLQ